MSIKLSQVDEVYPFHSVSFGNDIAVICVFDGSSLFHLNSEQCSSVVSIKLAQVDEVYP